MQGMLDAIDSARLANSTQVRRGRGGRSLERGSFELKNERRKKTKKILKKQTTKKPKEFGVRDGKVPAGQAVCHSLLEDCYRIVRKIQEKEG